MKKTRLLAFLALCCLLLAAVPLSGAAEEAPKLYFDLNFDDLPVGAIQKKDNLWMTKPDGSTDFLVFFSENTTQTETRWGENNCAVYHKPAGSKAASGLAIMPFNVVLGLGEKTLTDYAADIVVQYDVLIDRDDGAFVYLFAAKSKTAGWQKNPIRLVPRQDDGTASMCYLNVDTNRNVYSNVKFTYGKWTRIAAVYHYNASGVTCDFYADGVPVFSGISPVFGSNATDIFQLTLGRFVNEATGAPADCTLSMDNIRVYSGSKPHTDAELGIVPSGSVLAGVQFSAVTANKYGMRLVGTVDGLNYASVGTDLSFSWKENGETKTKTASKTASAVYDSILATADGAIEAYTAENLGGKYLWALTIDGIPTAAGEVTVDVDCWSMTDGVKTVQCRMRLVVKDGKLLSSCML